MAITTLDGLIAGLKPPVPFYKATISSEGAGTFSSMWKCAGYPAAGSNPPAYTAGSGYQCTRTTNGAMPFVNPVSGETILSSLSVSSSVVGGVMLVDRLWTCSGFSTTSISAQNITTPGTIPARDANGAALGDGVEIWLEVYSVPGATAATWTVAYTDQGGSAGSGTYSHPANAETAAQTMIVPLAAGDVGVRAVASFTCSISSGTAGDIGITLLRRLSPVMPISVANVGTLLGVIASGGPVIYDDSCLALMFLNSSTTVGNVIGSFTYSQG